MEATRLDILDLVQVTVGNIRIGGFDGSQPATDVTLDGDNILIGENPVSIASIMSAKNSAKGFLALIRRAM